MKKEMKKEMKNILKILLIIVSIIVVIIVLVFNKVILLRMPWNISKAGNAAKEYVLNTFSDEIIFDKIQVASSFEPLNLVYEAIFYPKNNTDLRFSVIIGEKFKVTDDDYFAKYFQYQMNEPFEQITKKIWGQNADFRSNLDVKILMADTPGLNHQMSPEEAKEHLWKYKFSVGVNAVLEDENIEAQRILTLFHYIDELGYNPYQVVVTYDNVDGSDINLAIYNNWKTYNDTEKILDKLEKIYSK